MIKQSLTRSQLWLIDNWMDVARDLENRDPNPVVLSMRLTNRIPPMFFPARPKFRINHYNTDDRFSVVDVPENPVPGEGVDILNLKKIASMTPIDLLWPSKLSSRGLRDLSNSRPVYGGCYLRHTVPTPGVRSDVVRFLDWILEGEHGTVFCPRLLSNSGFYRWNNYIGVLTAYTPGESPFDDSDLIKPTHVAYRRIDFLKLARDSYQRISRITSPQPNKYTKMLEVRSIIKFFLA